MPIRFVAQRSSEDAVHILSSRPLTQWALCGEVVGHDWLVRREDVELSRTVIDVCATCRRTMWKTMREEARELGVEEPKAGLFSALWSRFRSEIDPGTAKLEPSERR